MQNPLSDKLMIGAAGLLVLGWLAQRFRWLDFLNREVGRSLTLPERWAIAAGGNLAEPNEYRFDRLPLFADPTFTRAMLREAWGIKRRAELREKIAWLETEGHSAYFEPLHATLMPLTPFTRQAWIDSNPESLRRGLQLIAEAPERFKNGRLVAWDMTRLINLVRAGRRLGWIDEPTAWSRIMGAARRIQAEYGSWRELSDNYLAAREWWDGDTPEGNAFMAAEAERLLTDPEGPWCQLPWDTPLAR